MGDRVAKADEWLIACGVQPAMLLNAIYIIALIALLPWVAWWKLSGGGPVASPWTRFTGGIPPLPRRDADDG